MNDRTSSQSLERGLAILSTFKPAAPELGITDLAKELGLSRSTSHRYVATLARLGYLEQNVQTRKYRLGPRVLDLGFSAINSMELRQISAPHLQKLADETGHTVNMAILDGTDIVYIERCRTSQPGQREIDLDLHVGSRLPAYCTSMGKVLLASRPDSEVRALIARMQLRKRGPNTLTAKSALMAELERVRRDGIRRARARRRRRTRGCVRTRSGADQGLRPSSLLAVAPGNGPRLVAGPAREPRLHAASVRRERIAASVPLDGTERGAGLVVESRD